MKQLWWEDSDRWVQYVPPQLLSPDMVFSTKLLTTQIIMKRKNFLLTSLFAIPVSAFAELKRFIRTNKGIKVAAGQDRFNGEIKFGGAYPNHLKVSGKDTDGDLCCFEGESDRKGGPPLHIHHEQDEIFYVVQGKFHFQVGNEKFELDAGDCLFAPRKVPHAFVHVGDEKSKMMIVFQPAGQMEAFFEAFGKFHGRPSPEQFQKLFRDHGMEIVGPPLPIG